MTISNLKLSDAGEYRCLVTNRAGEVQAKFEVETLCNHLGSAYCRELEHRHIAKYRQESERRRQLAQEEQQQRRLAMHQWNFDASQRGVVHARQHVYPEYSVNVAPREAVYLSAGTAGFQTTEYSDNNVIQNLRADLLQFRREKVVTIRSTTTLAAVTPSPVFARRSKLSYLQKLKRRQMHRKNAEQKLLESLMDFR